MNKEKETVVKKYIPSIITKEWSEDGSTVKYIKKSGLSEGESLIDEMFTETFVLDYGYKNEDHDLISIFESFEFFDGVKKGDKEALKNNEADIAYLLASQYYLNRNSHGAFDVYKQNNEEKVNAVKSDDELIKFLVEVFSRTRGYSEWAYSVILIAMKSMYLFDLKCTLLYADENTSFFMGDQPMVMMNALGRSENLFNNPFCFHGLIMLMPVSPKVAVCIYDDSVYKIKKKDGKTVLPREDVGFINRYIADSSDKVIYRESEKDEKDWVISLLKEDEDRNDLEGCIPSVFRILASSVDLTPNTLREYCKELLCYDAEHLSEEIFTSMDERFDYVNNLLKRLGLDQ